MLGGGLSLFWHRTNKQGGESQIHVNEPFVDASSSARIEEPRKNRLQVLTSGVSGEALTRALEIADTIAREHTAFSDAEASHLLDFVSGSKPSGLTRSDWQHLVNSLFNALRTRPAAPARERLSLVFANMAEKDADPVMRLYALQHISFWLPHEQHPARKQQLADLLLRMSQAGDQAGCATMVMSDLQRAGSLPQNQETNTMIDQAALRLASDPDAVTTARVSAIHTLADRGQTESLPELRSIAMARHEHIVLRKAAIFAIGRLGNLSDDRDRLKRLASEHRRLAQAAEPAIQSLVSRK